MFYYVKYQLLELNETVKDPIIDKKVDQIVENVADHKW